MSLKDMSQNYQRGFKKNKHMVRAHMGQSNAALGGLRICGWGSMLQNKKTLLNFVSIFLSISLKELIEGSDWSWPGFVCPWVSQGRDILVIP